MTNGLSYPLADMEADILIHSGDFSVRGKESEITRFNEFLASLTKIKHKIVIAGNHDKTFDPQKCLNHIDFKNILTDCIYLEDSSVEIMGIKIYGSPWVPFINCNFIDSFKRFIVYPIHKLVSFKFS